MNEDDKRMFLALVKGKDVSEIISLLAESGNQYSRRTAVLPLVLQVGSVFHYADAHVRNIRL